jgi:hypothetical protein
MTEYEAYWAIRDQAAAEDKKFRKAAYRKALAEIKAAGGSVHQSVRVTAARYGRMSGRKLVGIIYDLVAAGVDHLDATDAMIASA